MSQEDIRRDIEQTIAEIEALAARSEANREEFQRWMAEANQRQERFLAELTEAADRPLPKRRDRLDVIEARITQLEQSLWVPTAIAASFFFAGLILWADWLN